MQSLSISKQAIGFLICLLVVYSAASTGAIASATAGKFYGTLVRPDWAPPGWVSFAALLAYSTWRLNPELLG